MSEFEKDENELLDAQENENEAPEVDSDTAAEAQSCFQETSAENEVPESTDGETGDGLSEELEGIRSKFQEILDETAQTYLAGGDIQDYDDAGEEEKKEDEEISEDELCECCGKKRRNTDLGEDYPYCDDCIKLMKHRPVSAAGVLSFIFILALTAVSIFFVFGKNAQLIDGALTASDAFEKGKIYSALEAYSTALQDYAPDENALVEKAIPKKVAARYAQTYASLLNYNYAYGVASQFLNEKDFGGITYRSLSEYEAKNNCYTAIMTLINTELQNGTDNADAICQKLEAMKEDENNDMFLIDYYEYIVIQYFGEKNEKQYEVLTALAQKYPDKWPVRYELCAVCSKLGKAEEAEIYLGDVIAHNSEDGAIYAYLADAYRFCENSDADKMLEVIEKGFAADGDSGYSATDLNRVKALALLLKGDYDSAYDAASAAYQSAYSSLYYGYSVNNLGQCFYTYQLCAHLKGDEDAFDAVTPMLGYVGLEESKDIKAFIKGTTSLENIITDAQGDLA